MLLAQRLTSSVMGNMMDKGTYTVRKESKGLVIGNMMDKGTYAVGAEINV